MVYSGLPKACYGVQNNKLIYLQPGQPWSLESVYDKGDTELNSQEADALNATMGVTRLQRAAMEAGAICGWTSPQAEPWRYDETGTPYEVHAGYVITSRTRIGQTEIVFGEDPKAPQPFVTWRANEWGHFRDYYWGHYNSDRDAAAEDYHDRIRQEKKDLAAKNRKPTTRRGPER